MKKLLLVFITLFSSSCLLANCVNFTGSYRNDKNFILKLVQEKCSILNVTYKNVETQDIVADKIVLDGKTCHNFIIFPVTHQKYNKRDLCVKYQFDKQVLEANIFSKRKRSNKYKLKGSAKYHRDALAGHKALYELYTGYKSLTDLDMNAMFDIRNN